jgi:hypothetical protein
MKRAWFGVAIALLTGCDALVGGECDTGFVVRDGACVPEPVTATTDGGGGSGAINLGGGGGQGAAGGGTRVSNGAGGASVCAPDLVDCGQGCIDLDTTALHCGACNHACPTQLCVDGACVGGNTGHTVVIAMSYQQSSQPTRRLFGNAVFLPTAQHVRMLDYRLHAAATSVAAVEQIIDDEAWLRGRSYQLDVAPSASAIAAELDVLHHDVLLIHDQANMPPGQVNSFVKASGEAIASFFESGGTVVALATSPVMAALLTESNMLDTLGFVTVTGDVLIKHAPTDALSVGVAAPLLAMPSTSVIVTGETESATLSFVLSDDTPAANPVVVHRVPDVL